MYHTLLGWAGEGRLRADIVMIMLNLLDSNKSFPMDWVNKVKLGKEMVAKMPSTTICTGLGQ
jgi:hypothetical protein